MRDLFGDLAREMKSAVTVDDINPFLRGLWAGRMSKSGVAVSVDRALQVTTVFACLRVLSEGIAQLPLKLYLLDGNDRKSPDRKNPLYKILAKRPNDWMTSFEFRETMTSHAALTGNAYAYIGRGLKDQVAEVLPLIPQGMDVVQTPDWGLKYRYTDQKGTIEFDRKDIFHLRGPSWNGYKGLDAVVLAREAIGLAIATEETHSALHKNGAQPGGILTVKGKLDKPVRERLQAAWEQFHGSITDRFKTAVLDVDATWTPLGMKGVDAEHIATRGFQIEEICRGFRVFPQMVMHTQNTTTFASAESFFLAHVTHSLMPWITRWEQSLERDFLDNADDRIVKLVVAALLRGDATSRSSFYEKALGGARGETAYMTRNEVRALEDLDPIKGGDELPQPTTPVAPKPMGTKPDAADKSDDVPESKVGRVLSNANEKRIRTAQSELDTVLSTLDQTQ